MNTPSDADLNAIIDAATPGEWSVKRYGRSDNNWIGAGEYDDVIAPANVECMAYCYGGSSQIELSDADATFIATFNPQLVASLLARAQAAEAELAALREGVERVSEAIWGDLGVPHNDGCEGEPTCLACICADLNDLLDSPADREGQGE